MSRLRTRLSLRSRTGLVMLAASLLGTGMVGIGVVVANAAPSPAAAPALIPCPINLPIPGLCDTPSPSASPSATTSVSASPTPTVTTSATASPTVSSTLSVTPTVTATHTTHPTPTPSETSTPGTGAHAPLAGFSHESATDSHPARVVITLIARGSKITKLTHVKLTGCSWSLGSKGSKDFGHGKRQVKITVNRSHKSTKGHVSFWAVNANHQHRVVKSAV